MALLSACAWMTYLGIQVGCTDTIEPGIAEDAAALDTDDADTLHQDDSGDVQAPPPARPDGGGEARRDSGSTNPPDAGPQDAGRDG
jgi:hypothetical protein